MQKNIYIFNFASKTVFPFHNIYANIQNYSLTFLYLQIFFPRWKILISIHVWHNDNMSLCYNLYMISLTVLQLISPTNAPGWRTPVNPQLLCPSIMASSCAAPSSPGGASVGRTLPAVGHFRRARVTFNSAFKLSCSTISCCYIQRRAETRR